MTDAPLNLDAREQTEAERALLHEATVVPDESSVSDAHDTSWFAGMTDRGRVRENNEDQLWMAGERNLFVVADGMGGHAAGEVASLIVVETLQRWLTPQIITAAATAAHLDAALAEALRQANAAVLKASSEHPQWSGMGSTTVVALLHGRALYIANVGDSRAYLLRSGVLQVLSQDHSVAAVLAAQNHITSEEIRTHPLRNRLTACLGIEEHIKTYISHFQFQHADRILLCSDGLWDMLTDQAIARLWGEHEDVGAAVKALLDAANRAGGQDNITVIALNIDERDEFLVSTSRLNENSSASPLKVTTEDTVIVAS